MVLVEGFVLDDPAVSKHCGVIFFTLGSISRVLSGEGFFLYVVSANICARVYGVISLVVFGYIFVRIF